MNSVSPINQKYNVTQSTQQVEKPAEQNQTEKKINKKVVVCSIAAAAGIIALASALIYKAKTGRINGASEEGEKIVENIKQFLNKDNQLVEGVTLNKGRAINADNTMFSGIMNTVNKKGEQITLEYQEGFIVSSKRNGKLFKKFENIANLTREEGVQITQYDKGTMKFRTLITNYDNGQVKRIYRDVNPTKNWQTLGQTTAIEFTPSGKVAAKAEYNSMGALQKAQIFDEDGRVIREIGMASKLDSSIRHHDNSYIEKEYRTDGTLKVRRHAFDQYYPVENTDDIRTRMLSENKLHRPKKVEYYDANGNLVQGVRIIPGREQKIEVLRKDGEDLMVFDERISYKKENSYRAVIYGEVQGDNHPLLCWDDGKFDFHSRRAVVEDISNEELKTAITATANKLEEAYRIIQKEDMPFRVGKDGKFTHIDIPTVVQQMRDFVSLY